MHSANSERPSKGALHPIQESAQTSANSERPSKGALHPIQESAQTAQAVSEISKGLQCTLTAITIVALWQLPHLGRGMCALHIYILLQLKGYVI